MDEVGIIDYTFFGIPISTLPWWDIEFEIITLTLTITLPWLFTRRSSEKVRRRLMWHAITVYVFTNVLRFLPRLLIGH